MKSPKMQIKLKELVIGNLILKMKKIVTQILSLISKLSFYLKIPKQDIYSSSFFKTRLQISKTSTLIFEKTKFEKVDIFVKGTNNSITSINSKISRSIININGNNNILSFEGNNEFVGEINIRGNNCKVIIGIKSTFGGVRIVNVGKDNTINIGKNCMFSDHIEIWASDTHTIYDNNENQINPEKPINIGNHVWVGSRAMILKGVVIGDDAIIGMGTLVTKNVRSNSISVGVPNKEIENNVNWGLDYKIL